MGRAGRVKGRPVIIGLTGNIATGKSRVASIVAALGAVCIDADQVAHEAMGPAGAAYAGVVEAFGHAVLDAEGRIDRARLGAIVFRDAAALRRLEEIVHPAVRAEVERRVAQAAGRTVVIEAIKLIEAGMHRTCDELWVVTAPRSTQIARLVATRGLTEQEAALRVDAQPSQQEKAALADRLIVNDGDVERLRKQVDAAWTALHTAQTGEAGHAVRGDEAMSIRAWIARHPRLTAWGALALGMVVILVWAAKDVGFLPGQWAALIGATILLAGLCIWIVGWDDKEPGGEAGQE